VPFDAETAEILRPVLGVEVVEVDGEGAGSVVGNVGEAQAGGAEDEAFVVRGQFVEKRLKGRVAESAGRIL